MSRTGFASPGRSVSARLPVRRGLLEMTYRKNPEPLKRTDLPPQAGAKPGRAVSKVKHPDNVVLEARRLREQAGVGPKQIVALLQQKGIDINEADVNRYCNYQTRGVLVPDQGASPYL